MDQSTKQRVVGIAVIVVAAAVILPVLFDGQGSYELPLESRIPEPVPFPTPPRVIPERPAIAADTADIRIDDTMPAQETAEPDTDMPAAQPDLEPAVSPAETVVAAIAPVSEAPQLDPNGLPQGWSVRLASFSNQANARNLLERLQSRGHRAYIREISSSQGPLTAVFVGPGVDRAAVQRLQQQLQEEFQLSGIVVRYEIEEL